MTTLSKINLTNRESLLLLFLAISIMIHIPFFITAWDEQSLAVDLTYIAKPALERLVEIDPNNPEWQRHLDQVNEIEEMWRTTR